MRGSPIQAIWQDIPVDDILWDSESFANPVERLESDAGSYCVNVYDTIVEAGRHSQRVTED